MILILILLLLIISILCHVYFLLTYFKTQIDTYFRRFLNTAVFNLFLAGFSIIIAIFRPEEVRKIQGALLLWFSSGLFMIFTLALQITIFIRISYRIKLPENYHYNFFGKKVYHPSILKTKEIVLFFLSIPVLLIAGSYFVARLIRFFI